MKNKILLLLFTSLFFNNQSVFAQKDTLSISGTVPSALNGKILIIKPFLNFNSNVEAQESLISNGKFSFTFLTTNLDHYQVFIKDSLAKNSAYFMLEPKKTVINFTDNLLKNNIVIGNEINTVYKNIENITNRGKYSLYKIRDTLRKLIIAKPDALINPYLIGYFYNISNTKMQDEEFLRLWKLIPDSATNNPIGNNIRFKANHLMVGTNFPKFSLPDTTGIMVESTKFNGKYLLVEFWASWCLPCRKETPGLLKVYEKYKKKNFDVLNISLDTKRELWLNALEDDKTTMWHNLSDLIEVPNSPVTHRIFNLTSIPHNYLINPDGIILAKDIWGKDLDKFLGNIKL